MNKKQFSRMSKTVAAENTTAGDPLEFEKIEKNADGKLEAFYHDSGTVYFISEDGTFNYACAR